MNPGDGPLPLILLVCLSLAIFAASVRIDYRRAERRQPAPRPDERGAP
jgi:hypothetical protein